MCNSIKVNEELLKQDFSLEDDKWQEICRQISYAPYQNEFDNTHRVYFDIENLEVSSEPSEKGLEVFSLHEDSLYFFEEEYTDEEFFDFFLKENGIDKDEFLEREERINHFLEKKDKYSLYCSIIEGLLLKLYREDHQLRREIENKIYHGADDFYVVCEEFQEHVEVENNVCFNCELDEIEFKKN